MKNKSAKVESSLKDLPSSIPTGTFQSEHTKTLNSTNPFPKNSSKQKLAESEDIDSTFYDLLTFYHHHSPKKTC